LEPGGNSSLVRPKLNTEYLQLYHWADVVALALFPNLHGSGITVIEEATVFGIPVVVSDVGGLRGYFSDQEVRYVPAADPAAMREAIRTLADDDGRARMVERAQHRLIDAGLTSRDFARRHAELSRELLSGVPTDAEARLPGRTSRGARPISLIHRLLHGLSGGF
jgi:glycosyltransferase involved in cell wall biosynthesis